MSEDIYESIQRGVNRIGSLSRRILGDIEFWKKGRIPSQSFRLVGEAVDERRRQNEQIEVERRNTPPVTFSRPATAPTTVPPVEPSVISYILASAQAVDLAKTPISDKHHATPQQKEWQRAWDLPAQLSPISDKQPVAPESEWPTQFPAAAQSAQSTDEQPELEMDDARWLVAPGQQIEDISETPTVIYHNYDPVEMLKSRRRSLTGPLSREEDRSISEGCQFVWPLQSIEMIGQVNAAVFYFLQQYHHLPAAILMAEWPLRCYRTLTHAEDCAFYLNQYRIPLQLDPQAGNCIVLLDFE